MWRHAAELALAVGESDANVVVGERDDLHS
jgi:hypothetical protein